MSLKYRLLMRKCSSSQPISPLSGVFLLLLVIGFLLLLGGLHLFLGGCQISSVFLEWYISA